MMPAANSIASIVASHGAWTDKSLVNVNVRSFDEAQLASIAASADDIARLARKGVRAGGDGLTPIRELFNRYGPMDYDPEAIAAVAGVHIDLVRAMARLGYLNVFKGRVVSVCA